MRGKLVLCLIIIFSRLHSFGQEPGSTWIGNIEGAFSKFSKQITNRAVVVGIFENGSDTLLTFGRINLFGRKPDGDDMFQIASVSKTFTGLMLSKAVVRGEVNLSSPLSDYLEIKGKSKYSQTSLLSLATHTAGLPNNTLSILSPPLLSYVGLIVGINQLILVPFKAPQLWIEIPWKIAFFPPPVPFFSTYGRKLVNFDLNLYSPNKKKKGKWKYSNVGVGVLGRILAENRDMSYEELLQEEIGIPYGLKNTTTEATKSQKRKFATPHNLLGIRTLRTKFRKGGIEGAGGIRSTGNDMLKYLSLQMTGVHTRDSASFLRQQKTYFISKESKRSGLEMGLTWVKYNPGNEGQSTIIWHNGQVAGSSAFIGFIPEKKVGIVVLSNNGKARKITKLAFHLLNAYE